MDSLSLILIGSELLRGEREDKNSKAIKSFCAKEGLRLKGVYQVLDDIEEIKKIVTFSLNESDFVITSGGIGSTIDDLTKEALSDLFNKELKLDRRWLKVIENRLKLRNKEIKDSDFKMAKVLEGSKPIKNRFGLSCGIHLEVEKKHLFVLPGVPMEFDEMFKTYVSKEILKHFKKKKTFSYKFILGGIRESEIEEVLEEIKEKRGVSFSILPSFGIVEVTFSSHNKLILSNIKKILEKRLKDNIISKDGTSVISSIKKELQKRGYSVSIAESLTGGELSRAFVSLSGISSVFRGAVVAYSNEAKVELLGVPKTYIENDGAVSEKVALAMVRGARARFLSECAIATTGIAGPTGGTDKKPVGLVYIALSKPEKEVVYKHMFPFSRDGVIKATTNYALFYFLKLLRENEKD